MTPPDVFYPKRNDCADTMSERVCFGQSRPRLAPLDVRAKLGT